MLHDEFFRKAKAEGYLARSAYKLAEIHEKKRLFRSGERVLDLGCAPGAWCQVAARIVGPRGIVVGVDLQEVRAALPATVRTIVGDAYEIDPAALTDLAGGQFDAVVSDMAPNTTGDPTGDHFISVRLCRRVLDLLPGLLHPGGNLAMKVFEGEAYADLLRDTAGLFESAKGFKPRASRDVSREIYIVAHGLKAPGP